MKSALDPQQRTSKLTPLSAALYSRSQNVCSATMTQVCCNAGELYLDFKDYSAGPKGKITCRESSFNTGAPQ